MRVIRARHFVFSHAWYIPPTYFTARQFRSSFKNGQTNVEDLIAMSNFGFRRVFQRPLRVLQQQAYAPSTATATRLDASQLLEEEKTPYYSPKNFYPAIIGQVLNDRYQLATKLGYGSGSTVWLARDVYQSVPLPTMKAVTAG